MPARLCLRSKAWLLVLLACLVLVPLPVYANAAPAQSPPGNAGLIASARTPDVSIDRETLTFDFTEDVAVAKVRATYYLSNAANRDAVLDLVFVAPGSQALAVSVDGVTLPVKEVQATLPAEWKPSTRVLDPRTGEEYDLVGFAGEAYTRSWGFQTKVAAGGKATLVAAYSASTGYDRNRADYVLRHTVYSLGPAKNWAGFGTLEVTARVPSRYTLAASPAMARRDDDGRAATYAARFVGVPADTLRLATVRTANPLAPWLNPVLYGLPVPIGLLVAWFIGSLAARLGERWRAFFVAGAATFAVCFVGLPVLAALLAAVEPLASAGEDLTAQSGYSATLLLIFWLAFAVPFGSSLVAGILAAVRVTVGRGDVGDASQPPAVPPAG